MRTEDHLEAAFGAADAAHYDWQTRAPFIADRERELSRAAFSPLGQRVLDLGCAEGATLYHLDAKAGTVGLDVFEDKLVFARKVLPHIEFVAGSAYDLPFEDGRFDHVLIRDVIHHIDDADRAMREAFRVLQKGGRIDILEPCRNNPLVFVHAMTNKAERGELRSTPSYLASLCERAGFSVVAKNALQPMPVHRLVFHLKMGNPALANVPFVRSAVEAFERAAGAVVPSAMWAYIHVRAEKR